MLACKVAADSDRTQDLYYWTDGFPFSIFFLNIFSQIERHDYFPCIYFLLKMTVFLSYIRVIIIFEHLG